VGNAYLQPVPVSNFVSQSNMSILAAQIPITPIQKFGPVHLQFNQQPQNQQNWPGIGRSQPPPNQNRHPIKTATQSRP
jgi:hypothetical protein